ncbi:hypothetical protein JCM11251_007113 [Rhodosporidiobolus azoricus]
MTATRTRLMVAFVAILAVQGVEAAGGHASSILSGGEDINPIVVNPAKPIVLIVVQLSLIIALSRLLAFVFGKARQPRVVSEILAGILLGPTAFGQIPGFTANIFPQASITYLTLLSELGLCLFLFCVGMEADLNLLKRNFKPSMAVSLAGLAVPFAIGCGVAKGLYDEFGAATVKFTTFMCFIGTSSSITALPVLARILGELGLMQDRVGLVALASGVVNDVIGWALLALSIALANAGKGVVVVYILLTLVGWMLFLTYACRPTLLFLARHTGSYGPTGPTQNFVCAVLVLVLVSGFFCECIGISSIFGAFLVGLIIPAEFCHPLTSKVEDVVSCILVPLYFATSGLSTNLTLLNRGIIWAWTVCVIVCAFCGKFIGCAVAARLSGFNWRESGATGSLMSAKGLIELIVLNQGLQAGIISETVFSIFVLEALLLTIASTPLTLLFYPMRVRSSSSGSMAAPPTSKGDEKSTPFDSSGSFPAQPGALPFKLRTRFTVVLDQVESLGAAMVFAHLFSSSSSTSSSFTGLRQPEAAAKQSSSVDGHAAGDLGLSSATGSSTPAQVETVDTVPKSALLASSGHVTAPTVTPGSDNTKSARSAPTISLTPFRLIELTDRTSSSLLASMSPSQLLASDPIIGLFRTFSALFGGRAIKEGEEGAEVRVEKKEGWAECVAKKATGGGNEGEGVDGVVVGWKIGCGGGGGGAGSAGGNAMSGEGESMIPNPFSHLFPSSNLAASSPPSSPSASRPPLPQSSSTTFLPSSSQSASAAASAGRTASFLRSLFRSSTTAGADVHLLLDLSSPCSSALPFDALGGSGGEATELFVPFFGGPDDRAALEMAAQLVLQSSGSGRICARVVVIEQAPEETPFDREVAGSGGDSGRVSEEGSSNGDGAGGGAGEVDKLAKELSAQYGLTVGTQQGQQGMTQTQTQYPTGTYASTRAGPGGGGGGGGGLASETADSVLLSQVEELFRPSSDPSAASTPALTIEQYSTAHPLRSLLHLLSLFPPLPSSSSASPPPPTQRTILLTGRSRHSPTLSHRLESLALFSLAAREGRLVDCPVGNKEVRLAVGEVGSAVVLEAAKAQGIGRGRGRGRVGWVWVVQAGRTRRRGERDEAA